MNDLMQFIEVLFLFAIFMIKKKSRIYSTSFGNLKYDCVIKTIEIFNFLPLINNSVTTGLSFLLLIISAIISSKTINTLHLFPRFYSSIFL